MTQITKFISEDGKLIQGPLVLQIGHKPKNRTNENVEKSQDQQSYDDISHKRAVSRSFHFVSAVQTSCFNLNQSPQPRSYSQAAGITEIDLNCLSQVPRV